MCESFLGLPTVPFSVGQSDFWVGRKLFCKFGFREDFFHKRNTRSVLKKKDFGSTNSHFSIFLNHYPTVTNKNLMYEKTIRGGSAIIFTASTIQMFAINFNSSPDV